MTDSERLQALVEDLRRELEVEVPTRLHPHVVGGGKHTKGGAAGDMGGIEFGTVALHHRASGGWTGLPFTRPFQKYLGHVEGYGYEFIAASSVEAVRDYCRQNHHESHLEPQPFGSRCWRLVVAVVELRQSLAFIGSVEGIGEHRARIDLLEVLRHAADWRSRQRDRVAALDMDAAAPAKPVAEMLRREHSTTQDEWDRLRLRYPYLPDWEFEQQRRLEQHVKLGCQECVVADAA